MQIDFPCRCGHLEYKHLTGQMLTICEDCLEEGVIGSRWTKASHKFVADNLRYLEQLSETKTACL
jgi:hypothetical protein